MEQLEQIDKRVTVLENSDRLKVEKLNAIESLLKKIEQCLIGGIGEEQVGLVAQVRDLKKELNQALVEIATLRTCETEVSDQLKKFKWMFAGVWSTLTILIGYWLKYSK